MALNEGTNMRKCAKCGKNKRNSSSICYDCNEDWDRYMKAHPLKFYPSQEESNARWHEWLKEKIQF